MIKIRNNVFETNSSSMHSLVIKKTSKKLTKEDVRNKFYFKNDDTFEVYDMEDMYFERYPFEMLTSPIRKFEYLIACYANNSEIRNKIVEIFKDKLELKEIIFPESNFEENIPDYGHIDHQSHGLVSTYLEKHNISFEDFIFDTKYIVIIDGDEYGTWDDIKDSGIINLMEIDVDINPWNAEN